MNSTLHRRRRSWTCAVVLTLLVSFWARIGAAQEEGNDDTIRLPPPSCELTLVKVRLPDGWYPIQLEKVPVDKEGCLLVRIMPDDTVGGIIRLTSTGKGVPGYDKDPGVQLLKVTQRELEQLHHVELSDTLKQNSNVPIAPASGFLHAMAYEYAGKISGNPVAQQIWISLILAPDRYVAVALISPNERQYPDHWKANRSAFQTILASLQVVQR